MPESRGSWLAAKIIPEYRQVLVCCKILEGGQRKGGGAGERGRYSPEAIIRGGSHEVCLPLPYVTRADRV